MTARLQRIRTLLRSGHVTCSLSSLPGAEVVLYAGNQHSGRWDVLVHDTDGELCIVDRRGAVQLPHDSNDATICDSIKLHIVQTWADQGNPEAKALISALQAPAPERQSTTRWAGDSHPALDMTTLFARSTTARRPNVERRE